MSVIPLIFTSGWASGINAYAVVLLLGLFGRFGNATEVPPTLERWDVLFAATLLFLCEFLADKIPYVDSVWDTVHTFVRPVMGGVIGALMAGHAHGSMGQVVAAALGGGTALVTHLVKAGLRMGLNTSPEPVSNIVVSMSEDLLVAAMVTLVLLHPILAASLAASLLVLGMLLVAFLVSRIRRFRRRRRERRLQRRAARGKGPDLTQGFPAPTPAPPPTAEPEPASRLRGAMTDAVTWAQGPVARGRDLAVEGKTRLDRDVREVLRSALVRKKPRD